MAKKTNAPATTNTPAPAQRGRRAGSSTVPADENKADKFRRLANMRVPAALKRIAAVGQLATKSYESTPEQRKIITDALNDAVETVTQQLAGTAPAASTFKI